MKIVLLIFIGWGGLRWIGDRPIYPPDGVLAADDPVQSEVANADKVRIGHWTLTVRANYQVTARILSRERYRFDALADLVPEDLALGWGPMSDNRTLRDIDVSQSSRFYYWHAARLPIAAESIITHSANTHVIARDPLVARQLSQLRQGQVITLRGELVDGVRDDGRWIKTSMVRTDTGAGACEVLLVDDVTLPAR